MALAAEEDKTANPEDVGFLGTGREVAAPADKAHLIQKAGLFGGGWLHEHVLLWGKTTCSTSECVNDRRIRSIQIWIDGSVRGIMLFGKGFLATTRPIAGRDRRNGCYVHITVMRHGTPRATNRGEGEDYGT